MLSTVFPLSLILSHPLQVLSASVAHAMELMGDPEMTETIRFVHFFDRFFDCLNVSSLSEGRHSRKPDLYPYRTPNDKRFTVCTIVVGLLLDVKLIFKECLHIPHQYNKVKNTSHASDNSNTLGTNKSTDTLQIVGLVSIPVFIACRKLGMTHHNIYLLVNYRSVYKL